VLITWWVGTGGAPGYVFAKFYNEGSFIAHWLIILALISLALISRALIRRALISRALIRRALISRALITWWGGAGAAPGYVCVKFNYETSFSP
jgi:hypothetical protein